MPILNDSGLRINVVKSNLRFGISARSKIVEIRHLRVSVRPCFIKLRMSLVGRLSWALVVNSVNIRRQNARKNGQPEMVLSILQPVIAGMNNQIFRSQMWHVAHLSYLAPMPIFLPQCLVLSSPTQAINLFVMVRKPFLLTWSNRITNENGIEMAPYLKEITSLPFSPLHQLHPSILSTLEKENQEELHKVCKTWRSWEDGGGERD